MKPESLDFTGFFGFRISFPFDCSAGFRCQIIENSVDAFDLSGDSLGDVSEQIVRDFLDACFDRIGCIDCADNNKKPFAAYPQRRAFIIWIVPVANRQE